uniref:8-oxo-dGDP phosphatase NUDT18 isoform X1 n=2 Tax=Pogona vitticeps TaxID=103695 RepID=A0ABM5EQ00_9SAUR
MASAAEEELEAVLGGQGWPVPAEGGLDAGPPGSPEPARLRRNTCFVVLAVVFNEQEEVLMTQEAKPECSGRWYLPAGRMEPGETVLEALRREVQEETGLLCQPVTLLAVEERGPAWIRFVFLARPDGGILKTLQEADAESLQARWWNRETPALPLRARDILSLMELALQYRAKAPHPPTLPVELPCSLICQRLLLVFVGPGDALWVLLGTTGAPHLPVAASGLSRAQQSHRLLVAVQRLLQKCLPQAQAAVRVRGLLGLQHLGRGPGHSDGICFNVVAAVGDPGHPRQESPPALQSQAFTWWKVENEALRSRALHALHTDAFLPLHSYP